ncbi:hypothetical protein PR202_ga05551 [Eleusine coracana subsp. coracana]|uniref:Uncharacterized protein n=1 Tax=Eleusine coracana subsp. coracana TaxID=191504 RepID=A0AAV5BRB2_ELECO|nr:hypothetical protein PR202_ga05098 [Eleusine coracana subsp. coracana]GJM89365.1 hypothetical protein PR202_ga05551 [Eleusine coracana subsp. coracana]
MLKDDVEVRSIRATLFQHFGDGASPKIKRFVKAMAGKLRQDGKTGAEVDALKRASGQEAHGGVKEAYAGTPASLRVPRNGVLVSGCQTNQTAGDKPTPRRTAFPTALISDAIQTVLAQKKQGTATNRELVLCSPTRGSLSSLGFTAVRRTPMRPSYAEEASTL